MTYLSKSQARDFCLWSQGLSEEEPSVRKSEQTTLKTIENLGYVQIDTISVVERAHHHCLWSRQRNYTAAHLDQLLEEKKVFEYWSHAAAYLPMRDYRFSLPRKRAIAEGESHWFKLNKKLMKSVLERIRKEGPLRSSDFESPKEKSGAWWDWKPTKKALEQLFIQGELMVSKRMGFQKVYDLTERVLPSKINITHPSDREYAQYLIETCLRAHGIARASEISYLRRGAKPLVHKTLLEMQHEGLVMPIDIEGLRSKEKFYALPNRFEKFLNSTKAEKRLHLLSPFDNLVIQRGRLKDLFEFDYQIECYVPEPKRKYGYFCLPILWGNELIGRLDSKADRKAKKFIIRNLVLEPRWRNKGQLTRVLKKAIHEFAEFNQCEMVVELSK